MRMVVTVIKRKLKIMNISLVTNRLTYRLNEYLQNKRIISSENNLL